MLAKLLEQIFSKDDVLFDSDSLKVYGKDWTKHIEPKASAVVFPRSTEQVARLVGVARKNKISLVPSGGRTGLSGGAIASQGEVVVSLAKMNKILEVNTLDQTITCEAGVITEELQRKALEAGFYFPVDFASRGSSQIGGNIATNAGGIKVIRYGLMRQWVTGLEVVTGSGDVLNLNQGLVKNATGYDLRHLFIGSEGTLGFICKATLALTQSPRAPLVFVFAVTSLDSIMRVYHEFRARFSLLAFEMFTDKAMSYVQRHSPELQNPTATRAPYYVLLEMESESTGADPAIELFSKLLEEGAVVDGAASRSPEQARAFWRLREDISEATSHYQPYKNDVSVRVSKVPEFLGEMDQILKKEYPDFDVIWFGHVGDGNLHINILKPKAMDSAEFMKHCHRVDEILFDCIERLGGSISAEHGVGLVKKPYLHHTRSLQEIELMKQIKKVFDPDGILNPGKIF